MAKYVKRENQNKIIISPDFGKIPPQANDIEMAVLGTMINHYHLIAKYPYLKPEVFYRESHQKIYKALIELYDKDCKPDLLVLTDHLHNIHELESIGGPLYLTQLSGLELPAIDTHVKIIMDKYFYRNLIYLSQITINYSFDAIKDPIDIVDMLQNQLMEMTEFDGDVQNNFKKTLEHTISNIKIASQGENITVIKSGFKLIDKKFTFRSRYVCIVAGPEASAKSKFVASIVRGMLDNEPNLAVQWFSFEDDRESIIRNFLSMDVKKTTKELQSINYTMTEKDITSVIDQSKKYEKYIIEFYDRATSIGNILSRSKRFSDKYRDKKRIIIIDNLGLIECDKSGIDRDDFIAAKVKSIADNNNNSVILLHHFTKEISRKANIEDGYRPRKEYLKGSTRILDYVQQALFVNLLRKYPDLLVEEKHLSLDFIGMKDIEFTETNFDKHLWNINSQPDKDTKSITDLRNETFFKIRSLLNNNSKFSNGKLITFSDIIQKYSEYNAYMDTRNKGREEKYKTVKSSIYMFIVRKEFNSNYISSTNSPRSLYLYGKNPNLKNYIDNLFIVEQIKNRDDDNISDNAIFRFIIDLGYNLFKEINDDGTFDNT
jgi:replicative DNA helicase